MKSWKTTVGGICSILGGIIGIVQPLVDGDPTTVPNFAVSWAAIMAGIALIFAKDMNVTGGTVSTGTTPAP